MRAYYPALADGALAPDYAGVRPKLSRETADFQVVRRGGGCYTSSASSRPA